MSTPLTRQDWCNLHVALARLLPPGAPPRTVEEVVEVGRLLDLVAEQMHACARSAAETQRAELVLSWRLPRERAPTMNEYAYLKSWRKKRLRTELDDELRRVLGAWPRALLHGAQRKRSVRVTRFSTQLVDELSVDVLGGKMPLDALVRCGVLHDDAPAYAHREALSMKTKRGNTHVLIEVFEMRLEGVRAPPPEDAPVTQVRRERGVLTRAIEEAAPPRKRRAKRRPR